MVNRLGWAVDASSEQKQKLTTIIQSAADDLRPLREKRLEARRQLGEVLAAPQVDRAKLEALRVDHMRLAEQASQRITTAIAEAADVLTPSQRADLVRRLEQRFGGRRG
jgi:Spy/CpxP family protein refolding chaperone